MPKRKKSGNLFNDPRIYITVNKSYSMKMYRYERENTQVVQTLFVEIFDNAKCFGFRRAVGKDAG